MTADADQASLLQNALREMAAEGRDVVAAPPFTAYLDPRNDLRYLNYAVPDEGAAAPWDAQAIASMTAAFAERARLPRLEIVDDCWPGLVDALVAAGFTIEGRLAGMTCEPPELRQAPAPADVTIAVERADATDEQIRARMEAQHAAFAGAAEHTPVTADDIARARARSGGSVAAWGTHGECVGAASWVGVRSGVSEIAGVGVIEAQRGRGIAGALTAAAARCAFDAGADLAFLTPGDDGAQRVYSRAGFRERVRCVHIARD